MSAVFEQARAVADAVLYTGYVQCDDFALARRYRSRWQFGVLVPPAFACEDADRYSEAQTECVLEGTAASELRVRLRFLRAQRVQVLDQEHDPVEALDVDGNEIRTCDEAVEHEREIDFSLQELLSGVRTVPLEVDGSEHVEVIDDGLGGAKGSIVRRQSSLRALLLADAEPIPGVGGATRLRLIVRNETPVISPGEDEDQASRHAMVAAHLLLGVENGTFVSQIEPPEWARSAVEDCRNLRCWPVLLGSTGRSDAVLSAPVLLNDDPAVQLPAARSGSEANDVDVIPALCTMRSPLEQEWERSEVLDQAGELIDDLDGMPLDVLERLHGTIRNLRTVVPERRQPQECLKIPWWSDDSEEAEPPDRGSLLIAGVAVASGSKVRLNPGRRSAAGTDVHLRGRLATVRDVHVDAGERYVVVTVDDDVVAGPAGEHPHRCFRAEEVEPVRLDRETVP